MPRRAPSSFRPWSLFSFCCTVAASCATASKSVPVTEAATLTADQWLVAAQASFKQGAFADAARAARRAAEAEPHRADSFLWWGRSESARGDLDAAVKPYESARKLGCRAPELFAELASVYDVLKKYSAAVAVYRDYLRDHGRDVGMQDELAMTLILAGKLPEAVAELENAVARAPQAAILQLDLGYAYLRNRQYDRARDTLVAYSAQPAAESRAAHYLARSYAGLGAFDDAAATLHTALRAHPEDTVARALLEKIAEAKRQASGEQ